MLDYDLEDLQQEALERLPDILEHFGLDYELNNKWYSMTCPIHDSDNYGSLTVLSDTGSWRCWTNHCESELVTDTDSDGNEVQRPRGKTLLGLVRSLLSVEHGRHVEYSEAISWLIKFTNYSEEENASPDKSEKRKFISLIKPAVEPKKASSLYLKRDDVRRKLRIPAKFYLERGYSHDILNKYDVGYCYIKGKSFYNRIVVPVYDENYEYVEGCLGRTIQPICPKCECFHYENIPCPEDNYKKRLFQKWKNNKGFQKESSFYNIWFAKSEIKKNKTAILVEGCGDIWRLEEAGIKIGLGLYGCYLSPIQKDKLDKLGVMTLILIGDNDAAGSEVNKRIKHDYGRHFNFITYTPIKEDIGEMSISEVQKELGPILEKLNESESCSI